MIDSSLPQGLIRFGLKIEGIDLNNIFYLRSIFDADAIFERIRTENIRNVVIAGGGYIGLELAESLIHRGKNVTIVELALRF